MTKQPRFTPLELANPFPETPTKVLPTACSKLATAFNAIPPALESERAVLGLILEGSSETERIMGLLGDGEHFAFEKHRVIYRTARRLSEEGQVPDLPSAVDRLRADGTLELCGGASYLFDLPNTGLACNAENYCRTIREAHQRSRLQERLYQSQIENGRGEDLLSILTVIQDLSGEIASEQCSDSSYKLKTLEEITMDSGEIEWCVKDLIPANGAIILSGDSGVGKTWLSLHVALAVAAGEPCFGRFETSRAPVLFIDEESGDRLLGARIRLLNGPGDQRRLPVHFAVFQTPALDTPEGQSRLVNTIREYGIRLVIIDVLLRVHSLDENAASEMSQLTTALSRIARTENCAFLILHHTRKKSPGSNHPSVMMRGSTEIKGGFDGHIYCEKAGDGRMRVVHEKSRYGPELDPFIVAREDTEDMMNVVAMDEKQTKLAEARSLICSSLDAAGEPVLRKDLEKTCGEEGISSRTFSDALKGLKSDDKIRETPVRVTKDGGKPRSLKAFYLVSEEDSGNEGCPQSAAFGGGANSKAPPRRQAG